MHLNKRFLAVLIFSCSFIASATQLSHKNYVVNLTGSMQGYGDITGPLWTVLKIKKFRPENNYFAIVDSRAEEIISTLYAKPLDVVSKELGIVFYSSENAFNMPIADVSLELFFGGRRIHTIEGERPFTNLFYIGDKTLTVVSDTMHGTTLDEVIGRDLSLYFKPPGIGSQRSGIIDSPDLEKITGKPLAVRKQIAANLFSDEKLKDLILNNKPDRAQLSFLYGAHNEIFEQQLIGQTKAFIQSMEKAYPSQRVLIFTPNTKAEIARVYPGFDRIVDLKQLDKGIHFTEKVYLVSLPKLTGFQFLSLMSIADLPILIEGNSSISSAIRLDKSFLLYRSPWNTPQIENILNLDARANTWLYSDVYNLDKLSLPHFDHYFAKPEAQKAWAQFILSWHVPDFATKLLQVIELAQNLTADKRPKDALKQARDSFKKTGDEYLEYSMVLDAYHLGALSLEELNQEKKSLLQRGFNPSSLEQRFVPNKPNFSTKFESLEKKVILYQTVNLPRSIERRARMESQFANLQNFPHRFIDAIEGKSLDQQDLIAKGLLSPTVHLKPGELGVYMTTLEKVIPLSEADHIVTVTFEDDIVVRPKLNQDFQEALQKAPADWDVLFLGCFQGMFADAEGRVSDQRSDQYNYELCPSSHLARISGSPWSRILSSRCVTGTWAYALQPKSAQKLSRLLRPIEQPIDVAIDRLIDAGQIKAYCATPELVRVNLAIESTIR